jgi:hypothetical protein
VGAAAAAPARAAAQSSLGVQGFGYPSGQLSTRASGTGGALAEFDPVSPVNPSALLEFGRTFAAFQYDPEFRQLTAGSATQRNTIARFPVVVAGGPFARRRGMFALSASTLLDRTFQAQSPPSRPFADDTVQASDRVESAGSIADVRFGAAYQVSRVCGSACPATCSPARTGSSRAASSPTPVGSRVGATPRRWTTPVRP